MCICLYVFMNIRTREPDADLPVTCTNRAYLEYAYMCIYTCIHMFTCVHTYRYSQTRRVLACGFVHTKGT